MDSTKSYDQSKGLIENTVSVTITVTDNIGFTNINSTVEATYVIVEKRSRYDIIYSIKTKKYNKNLIDRELII